MPVYLRKRKRTKDFRYFLDIYHNGERRYEFLDLYQVISKNPADAEINRQHKEMAETARANRHLELEGENYDIEPKHKKQIYFIDYFEKWVARYPNKDVRLAEACLKYFKSFLDGKGIGKLTSKQVTKELTMQFRGHLDSKLNGETPHNYFGKFIKLCNDATEDNVFRINPCRGIKNKRPDGLKKDILSIAEILKLKDTACSNEQVKKAFLFSLNTGLRWVDVKALKWQSIDGDILRVSQSKTGKEAIIYLNEYALSLLSERGNRNDLVFRLPSHSYALRAVDNWVTAAKIDKHITWHSGRHSFAVNLLINRVDVKTMSSLLGHAGLKHTEKYTRVVDELKKQAVKSINI